MTSFKYKNITFEIEPLHKYDEDFGIGTYYIEEIPSKDIIGMKRDGYYNEVTVGNRVYRIISHLSEEDYFHEDVMEISTNSSIKDSWNTDLNIVYFKYLVEHPRIKRTVKVRINNPYWLFHDICHEDDVHGHEVCCLSASLEEYRLKEGLRTMVEAGYTPEFTKEEFEAIHESFYNRWKVHLEPSVFKKYVIEEYDEEYSESC